MRIFFRLLQYVIHHKGALSVVFVMGLIGVVAELARPWPIKLIVDNVLAGRPLTGLVAAAIYFLPGANSNSGLLIWCVVAAATIAIGGAVISLVVTNLTIEVAQRLVFDLSRDLFDKLQQMSLSYYGRHEVGDLLQRMSGDVFVVYFVVAQVILPGTIALLALCGMTVIMLRLDTTLAIIALSVVPLLAGALALFTKPMNDSTERQYKKQGQLTAFVQQSLSAIQLIQGFARESYVQRKLETHARDFGHAFGDATRISTYYNQVTTLITGTAAALLLGLGALRVMNHRLSVGELLVFLGYLTALYGPVNSLATSIGACVVISARGRRVFDILDSEEIVREAAHPIALGRARGEVIFENVTFHYPLGEKAGKGPPSVLRDINLHAQPGQITAIVGATGAGKTSLVSLLSRFYDPEHGRILIDGHDLRELSLKNLRENISLVLQEPFLFPMSVADNIAFGRPDATRDEIISAARTAHAHSFIERLPKGYDTLIGERGASLSGGERQRIAIARALLKDAPILVLDEPTSALDAHTEAKIFEALARLMEDRTTFIISHRLSTIRRADQILALEHGRIVERGTHESLIATGSTYAHLYRHQHIAAL